MDLSFCLYCEKHLNGENESFCSFVCQANEASKPIQNSTPSRLLPMTVPKLKTTTTNPSYELAYHRRAHLSIVANNNYKFYYHPSLSSSSSSTISFNTNHSGSSFNLFSLDCPTTKQQQQQHHQQNVYFD